MHICNICACIDLKRWMSTKPTGSNKIAASGASDFGGGYEMPGHGRWMQDYPFHSHHFNRKIMGTSYFPNLLGGHVPCSYLILVVGMGTEVQGNVLWASTVSLCRVSRRLDIERP